MCILVTWTTISVALPLTGQSESDIRTFIYGRAGVRIVISLLHEVDDIAVI